jgi:acyl-lipid omega-6 desaturase (Delta-12 desaturase)
VTSIAQIKQVKQTLIKQYARPDDLTGLAQTLTTLGPLALLWWAAILSLEVSWWLTALATLLISLFTLRNLVLMHECGHNSLFRSQWLNRSCGFLFGVVAGMPQYVWSQHHDFHHANNGNWDKYRGPLTTPSVAEFAAMTKAQQQLYLRTRSIGLAPLGGFVYLLFNPRFTWMKGSVQLVMHLLSSKIAQPAVSLRTHAASFQTNYWKSRKEYWHMFWNNLVLLSLWLVMCMNIGALPFFVIYLSSISLAGGAGIILFTVQHNFEHAYASESSDWSYDTGAIQGTSMLVLPRWLNWFTANIAYHHVHHLSAKIPNYHLAACHREYQHLFDDVRRIRLSAIPAALKCLLWDTRTRRIISMAEYRQQRVQTSP